MIQVVSFDYLPLGDYIDFGFTATDPWSTQFEYLAYESINFVEGLGSIALTIWIGGPYLIFVALRHVCCKNKCVGKYQPIDAWDSTLAFFAGTFFEVMVCLSVSMRMFTFYEYLNGADKFAIANQMIVCVPMLITIFLSVFFAFCRAP